MNVIIVDSNKFSQETVGHIYERAIEISCTSDWIVLPRGIEIIQDVPIEWLKHIRDIIDEKINRADA